MKWPEMIPIHCGFHGSYFFNCAVNSYSEPPMETHIKHVPPVL